MMHPILQVYKRTPHNLFLQCFGKIPCQDIKHEIWQSLQQSFSLWGPTLRWTLKGGVAFSVEQSVLKLYVKDWEEFSDLFFNAAVL